MRVSFDLDNTLILRGEAVRSEQRSFPFRLCSSSREPLRHGTRLLFRELRRRGCNIWIYTTSGRTSFEIRRWLFSYGIWVDGVINEERHRQEMARHKILNPPSKYPPAFQIDLHVDDSDGVRMEGERYGFRVVLANPLDEDWALAILKGMDCPDKS